jgi:hypothetical protein
MQGGRKRRDISTPCNAVCIDRMGQPVELLNKVAVVCPVHQMILVSARQTHCSVICQFKLQAIKEFV